MQVEPVRAVLVVARRCGRWWPGPPAHGPGGSTPRPCCRRSRACSSRTASRRGPPSPAAPGAGRPGGRAPRTVTTSWPSRAAAGTRQALSAVHRVPPVVVRAGRPAPSRRRTRPRRSPPWRRSGPGRGASPARWCAARPRDGAFCAVDGHGRGAHGFRSSAVEVGDAGRVDRVRVGHQVVEPVPGDLGDLDQRGRVLLGLGVVQPVPAAARIWSNDSRSRTDITSGKPNRSRYAAASVGRARRGPRPASRVSPRADWSRSDAVALVARRRRSARRGRGRTRSAPLLARSSPENSASWNDAPQSLGVGERPLVVGPLDDPARALEQPAEGLRRTPRGSSRSPGPAAPGVTRARRRRRGRGSCRRGGTRG